MIAEARRTKQEFNIGLWRQFGQAVYLRWSRCRLDPWEYYFFQIYLDRYPMNEKQRFVGWRREIALDRAANPGAAREAANDKLLFHALLTEQRAPVPKLLAVYSASANDITGAVTLRDRFEVTEYLQHKADVPLFIKPVRGTQGRDVHAIGEPARGANDLRLLTGERVDIRSFASRLDPAERGGWLFQELLYSDPSIRSLCGERLTSVRIIVVVTPDGPEILSAVWRIPTGTNITDNFDVGRTGNITAGIKLDSGRVMRSVQGAGWRNIPVTRHPDTGAVLEGYQLPGWNEIRTLCLDLPGLFPELRLQHWDIALTDRGPVVLEVNVSGGMRTHQIVRQRGIFCQRLARFQ